MTDKTDAAQRVVDDLTAKIEKNKVEIAAAGRLRFDLSYDAIVEKIPSAQQIIGENAEWEVVQLREQETMLAALTAAQKQLANAEREAAAEADAERAAQRQVRFAALHELGTELDRTASEVATLFSKFQKEAAAIGRLAPGSVRPSVELVSVGTRRALAAHLRATGLPLQAIPPSQRLTFAALARNWSGTTATDEDTATAA